MLWGSGTSNGRGPRYTAAALADRRLPLVLEQTAELVATSDLHAAHETFRVKGHRAVVLHQVVLGGRPGRQ